jgi:hypothetical protein
VPKTTVRDLRSMKTRQLGGAFSIIVQFAPQLAEQKGKTSFAEEKFAAGYGFGRASEDEVLLCFNSRQEGACQHTATKNTCVMPRFVSAWPSGSEECRLNSSEPAVVLLHGRPLCEGHVVVVPDLSKHLPQALSEEYLTLGFAFAIRASPRAWLAFSSVGAGAEVDHLHWEAFFAVPSKDAMFPFQAHISNGGVVLAAEPRGPISLSYTPSWPIRAWIFTWENPEILQMDTALVEWRMAEFVHEFTSRLQGGNIDFHVFLSSGGTRATVVPRKALTSGAASASRWKVSCYEVLGWWAVEREQDFEALDEESAMNSLYASALGVKQEKRVVQALRDAGWHLTDSASQRHQWSATDAAKIADTLHATDTIAS